MYGSSPLWEIKRRLSPPFQCIDSKLAGDHESCSVEREQSDDRHLADFIHDERLLEAAVMV
jgi:hypothetical protein